MFSLFENGGCIYSQSLTENSGFLCVSGVSERRGWGGGGGGDSHRVQPQVQGWSFFCWWRALLVGLQLLRQLGVQLLHRLAALWSPGTASHKVSVQRRHKTHQTRPDQVLHHKYTFALFMAINENIN